MQRAHLASTRVLSALLLVLGLAMAVTAIAAGGGPASIGFVFGLLFAALGGGRLWLATRPES